MKLVLGGINGFYLREVIENALSATDEVIAAVAYANDTSSLFDWCIKNKIKLTYYGRLDDAVAVSLPVLQKFISVRSPNFTCRLVEKLHAKIIWWRGYGAYIGSANLTNSAWYSNIEAGCFFTDEELDTDRQLEILEVFEKLRQHATELTDEVFELMRRRTNELNAVPKPANGFWTSPHINRFAGLSTVTRANAVSQKRLGFLKEWNTTLQQLRSLASLVAVPANRPSWVNDAPQGAQADQFLHAHYYNHVLVGQRAPYEELYHSNKADPQAAVDKQIEWWRSLKNAPSGEDAMLNIDAPFLKKAFSEDSIEDISFDILREIFEKVHAIKEFARRASNKSVDLIDDGRKYSIPEKVDALAAMVWNRTSAGSRLKETLRHVLYGGAPELVPERLWDAFSEARWKIPGLGIGALGEIVGWALPDRFPPRNGRTSKALRSLGYDVKVYGDG